MSKAVSETATTEPVGTEILIAGLSSASASATLNVTPALVAVMPLTPVAESAANCGADMAAMFAAKSEIVTFEPLGTVIFSATPSSASACATFNATPPLVDVRPLIPVAANKPI